MAKYQYVKKKLNVKVLILLLLCAFLPGIIYLIWAKIPRKVLLDAPTKTGWIARLVGTAVLCLNWIAWKLILETNDYPVIFYLGLAFGAVALIGAILSKKTNKNLFLIITVFFSLCALGFSLAMIYYGWPSIIGAIVSLVGCSYGFKYSNYVNGKAQLQEEAKEEVEQAE